MWSGFNPFATAFSRKSRTRLQERTEQGLASLLEQQARRQQRFATIEDRNVTILLQTKPPREKSDGSDSDTTETEEGGDAEQRELELVAQLWRDRRGHDDVERFETSAAKKLRLLRGSKMYPYVLVRVRLPGGVYLQARFNLEESLEVRSRSELDISLFRVESLLSSKSVCFICVPSWLSAVPLSILSDLFVSKHLVTALMCSSIRAMRSWPEVLHSVYNMVKQNSKWFVITVHLKAVYNYDVIVEILNNYNTGWQTKELVLKV